MPQVIANQQPKDEKVLKMYMRVRQPEEHVKLTVKDQNGDVLTSLKRDIVAPGSMEMIPLPVKYVNDQEKSFSISVEKE